MTKTAGSLKYGHWQQLWVKLYTINSSGDKWLPISEEFDANHSLWNNQVPASRGRNNRKCVNTSDYKEPKSNIKRACYNVILGHIWYTCLLCGTLGYSNHSHQMVPEQWKLLERFVHCEGILVHTDHGIIVVLLFCFVHRQVRVSCQTHLS